MSGPDSEPGSGHADPNHDWNTRQVMKVPTGFPEHMQFTVKLLECSNCGALMTSMAPPADGEETYRTPACGRPSVPSG